jgi:exodeoxyribonuclease III
MKIISWNVNGFRSVMRKGVLHELLEKELPDVLLLQEIKCPESDFASYHLDGYNYYVNSGNIAGRHGTAILVKEEYEPDVFAVDPPVDGTLEGRLQAMVLNGILIVNTYSVNVREGLTRQDQRYSYDYAIKSLLANWYENGGKDLIILGDLNVVSEAVDYHGSRIINSMAGMSDMERSAFHELLVGPYNLVDTFRHLNPETRKYSYWSNFGNARGGNKGWRLDYALASNSLLDSIESSDIMTEVKGSDHAPIIITLR